MSCSMTIDAVLDRTKTVTRRHVDTWRDLKPGDRLTLIEKGMGLPKGARQVVLAEVEITRVTVEPIGFALTEPDVCAREGLPWMLPEEFIAFWLKGHGYRRATAAPWAVWHRGVLVPIDRVHCRRIEWRYLDEVRA